MRKIKRNLGQILVFLGIFLLGGSRVTSADDLSPPVREENASLNVFWVKKPLRSALKNLSETQNVSILLDRRIDPELKLDLSLKNASVETVLEAISAQYHLGLARLGRIVYLGPPKTANWLKHQVSNLKKQVWRLSEVQRQKFMQMAPLRWDDATVPRDLLVELCQADELKLIGLERMPHDLWAAADLAPASLLDRLILIVVQFDLTLKISDNGNTLEIVPIVYQTVDDKIAPGNKRTGRNKSSSEIKSSEDRKPDIEQLRIQKLSVREETLDTVLHHLADRLGLELAIDTATLERAGISLQRRVTFTVENATIDEIFSELLKGTGLKHSRRGSVLEIVPENHP